MEERRYSSNVLDLGTRFEERGQIHAPAALHPSPVKKKTQYQLDMSLDGLSQLV
jgi:hypothetical protein